MNKDVTLKFKKFEDPDLIELAVERIRMVPGVVNIDPVFPDTNDSELKRLHVLKVVPLLVEQVLAKLKQDPNVELAYEPPARTL